MDEVNYKYVKQPNYNVFDFLSDLFSKGWAIAKENMKIRKSIERALLDSTIGIRVNSSSIAQSGKITLKLPEILIQREKGLKIFIQNSVKFQETLSTIDISSAIDGYVVETSYLSENRQYFIYECEPVGIDYQITFESLKDLVLLAKEYRKKGKIPIDKRLTIPFSHMIITGMTGSGKTTALYYLLLFLEYSVGKLSIYVIDPKQEALLSFGEIRGYSVASEPGEILDLMRNFIALMDRRQESMRRRVKKSRKFDIDAFEFGLRPYFIFIDELAALNAILNKDEKAEFFALLSRLILLGRSLGFYAVISLQQNNARELSTAIKEQIGFKVVLGNSGKQSYATLFDDLEGANGLLKQKRRIGEGVYTSVLNGSLGLKKVRFPHLKFLG